MSFWLISLNLKGIEGLLLGESRCCRRIVSITCDWEIGGKRTYDLEGFACHAGGCCEGSALGWRWDAVLACYAS